MDNVALRCFYNGDSLTKHFPDYAAFFAAVVAPPVIKEETAQLELKIPAEFENQIEFVDFFAKYTGFDENGNINDADWHGNTFKREWTNHAGHASSAPFSAEWNTMMIPDQSKPIQFKAIIKFKNDFYYETEATAGSILRRTTESVHMFYCYQAPIPFWSRADNIKIGKMNIPIDPNKIIKAKLQIKIWDGGEGDVSEPFKINSHAYPITSKMSIHDVVHTSIDIDPSHLKEGENETSLLSDTHHHGIEILRPGPCIFLRVKK